MASTTRTVAFHTDSLGVDIDRHCQGYTVPGHWLRPIADSIQNPSAIQGVTRYSDTFATLAYPALDDLRSDPMSISDWLQSISVSERSGLDGAEMYLEIGDVGATSRRVRVKIVRRLQADAHGFLSALEIAELVD